MKKFFIMVIMVLGSIFSYSEKYMELYMNEIEEIAPYVMTEDRYWLVDAHYLDFDLSVRDIVNSKLKKFYDKHIKNLTPTWDVRYGTEEPIPNVTMEQFFKVTKRKGQNKIAYALVEFPQDDMHLVFMRIELGQNGKTYRTVVYLERVAFDTTLVLKCKRVEFWENGDKFDLGNYYNAKRKKFNSDIIVKAYGYWGISNIPMSAYD